MKNRQKDLIDQLSDRDLMINFYLSQFMIFCIGLLFAFILFPSIFDVFHLFNFTEMNQILVIGGGAGIFVVSVDLIMMKYLPSSYFDDGGMNERIFKNRGVLNIIFITLIVAFCEEFLFRGVLQTKFGLLTASIIFALVHYRYLFNKFLLSEIILLSLFIGVIFEWTENLAVTFFMHFIIDCLLGLYIYYTNSTKPFES